MPVITHRKFAEVVSGYELNPRRSYFSIVVPEETINLVANPSVEIDTTGYTAVGGTIARTTDRGRRGAWSLRVTPTAAVNDGMYYGTVALVVGSDYTFSLDFWGAGGGNYTIYFATTAGAALGNAHRFTASGGWQRISVSYCESVTNSRRVYVTKDNQASTQPFFVDGLQVEAKSSPTTYCDGDQDGLLPNQLPAAFTWSAARHASTSLRSALTRAGGRIRNLLDEYGFHVLSFVGLGMPPINNVSFPMALLDGALFQRTTLLPRTFSLVGAFTGASIGELLRHRRDLLAVLSPDEAGIRQPVAIRYQLADCEDGTGDEIELVCLYAGGLEGNIDNENQERAAIQFVMLDPTPRSEFDVGETLNTQELFVQAGANTSLTIWQDRYGSWHTVADLGTHKLLIAGSHMLYLGGSITSGPVIPPYGLLSLNTLTGTLTQLGAISDPGNEYIMAMAIAPNGLIYIGGRFTSIGGVAANHIASYDPATGTFAALGSGASSQGTFALVCDIDGNLYAGGQWASMGGVANTAGIAKWDGSAWSSIAIPGDPAGLPMAVGLDGRTIYTSWFSKYLNGVWTVIGLSGGNNYGGMVFSPGGLLYVQGNFTAIDGVAANGIAVWDGTTWKALGSGLTGTFQSYYNNIGVSKTSKIIVGVRGDAATAGGVNLPGMFAIWDGTNWVFPPIEIAALNVNTYAQGAALMDGDRPVLSYFNLNSQSVETYASQVTEVTNDGAAHVYPRLRLTHAGAGTAVLWYLANEDTGARLYFNEMSIAQNEIVTISTEPGDMRIESNTRGGLFSYLLPGSNIGQFYLKPGLNHVGLFYRHTIAGSVEAVMYWRERHAGVEGSS